MTSSLVEHAAGDLMDEPSRHAERKFNESIIGTGYWYFHEAVHAPTDPKQDNADRIENQLDAFGKTFLGLTIGLRLDATTISSMRFQMKTTIPWRPICKEAPVRSIPLTLDQKKGRRRSGRFPRLPESFWMKSSRMRSLRPRLVQTERLYQISR